MMTISFVLPFYKKAHLFRQMLPVTDAFQNDDVELVLVLDDPSDEKEVLRLVKEHSGITFRVIVNDYVHEWRPPSTAINVGIRFAMAPHVAIMSPETALVLPCPTYLHQLLRRDWRTMYSGLTWSVPDVEDHDDPVLIRNKIMTTESIRRPSDSGYGFLLTQRYALERICGYDERWPGWGQDDNDIRCRLIRCGLPLLQDGNIRAFHAWHEGVERRKQNHFPDKNAVCLYDQAESWGRAFGRLAHDWNIA